MPAPASCRDVPALVAAVDAARGRYLAALGRATAAQAGFRPAPTAWSLVDVTEHLVLAERGGIQGMWAVLEATRRGTPPFTGEALHRGLPIEAIIARTWREREVVPAVAAPAAGGPLAFWAASLAALQPLLVALGEALVAAGRAGLALETVIHPHPISGPLDVFQRLEFLRFHIDRHAGQVAALRAHPDFPR